MDVDIMSPEYDVQGNDGTTGHDVERDPESEEIVKQLEKGLPQWPGFGEEGWVQEASAVCSIICAFASDETHLCYRTVFLRSFYS